MSNILDHPVRHDDSGHAYVRVPVWLISLVFVSFLSGVSGIVWLTSDHDTTVAVQRTAASNVTAIQGNAEAINNLQQFQSRAAQAATDRDEKIGSLVQLIRDQNKSIVGMEKQMATIAAELKYQHQAQKDRSDQ